MASLGIWTIRILRWLPHTEAFGAHLARCAFAEVVFQERLTFGKILGWTLIESGTHALPPTARHTGAARPGRKRGKVDGRAIILQPTSVRKRARTLH